MADWKGIRILVVEDEQNVGSTLVDYLQREGADAVWSRNREDAQEQITGRRFDLALLDVGLPDGTGFQVAEQLRSRERSTAVVFLTAMGSPEDRVRGLELGAEDYVVKPFHLKELMLRLQNALKRARYAAAQFPQAEPDGSVQVGRARVYFNRFEALVDDERHSLSHKECALLRMLVERRGEVVSRDQILDEVWSEDEFPTSRTVDNFILRLRRLVEHQPDNPKVIRSVRGVGYQLFQESE
jgi:two-component system alkaline phosphatase synthesis response regulator PhoP